MILNVVSREKWLAARTALLEKEKQLTRLRDELRQERLALPWVRLEKNYVFDGPRGQQTLADLFDGRRQLIVYHFMLGPGWKEGCVGCSFRSDHVDGPRQHFEQRDLSYVNIARAPWSEIEPFQKRMGWKFHWVSSYGSDFNYDFGVSFRPEAIAAGQVRYNYADTKYVSEELSGTSVFYRDEDSGDIFHTYSTYARGEEGFISTYDYLDIAPLGRQENGPRRNLTDWVRHHDRYGAAGHVNHDGRYIAAQSADCGCHP